MANTARDRFSPFGIALFVVGILAILIFAFIMTQRGGEVTGDVGADGINPVPEQIGVDDVRAIEGTTPDPVVEVE